MRVLLAQLLIVIAFTPARAAEMASVEVSADQRGFAVVPRRWAVERTLAWLTAHRRLARDYERDPATSEAFIRWAAINTMIRRLDCGRPAKRQTRRLLNPPE